MLMRKRDAEGEKERERVYFHAGLVTDKRAQFKNSEESEEDF